MPTVTGRFKIGPASAPCLVYIDPNMASLLFPLRHVPDDEAEEVRALLSRHGIDFYETPASAFGVSAGAIWLRDDAQLQVARRLIDDYQAQRYAAQRQRHEELDRQGQRRTIAHIFRESPLRFVAYLAVIGAVLYLSLKPFFALGK